MLTDELKGGPTIMRDVNCESHLNVKFFCPTQFAISLFQCLTNSTMGRCTIEQRVKIVGAFYENGRSNQNAFRALRDLFGQYNRPNVYAIGRIVRNKLGL